VNFQSYKHISLPAEVAINKQFRVDLHIQPIITIISEAVDIGRKINISLKLISYCSAIIVLVSQFSLFRDVSHLVTVPNSLVFAKMFSIFNPSVNSGIRS